MDPDSGPAQHGQLSLSEDAGGAPPPDLKPELRAGPPTPGLLRGHKGGPAPVSFLELFFDLVYVFAITQLSHFLLKHHDFVGVAEAVLMFAAVWWAWMYTTWAANWADPERVPVRLMLLLVMLASMIMAVAIPRAFSGQGMAFAIAYVAIQVGRSAFMAWVMRSDPSLDRTNMPRITLWFCLSGVGWIVGALQEPGAARIAWWAAALVVEYLGPVSGFRVPGLGRSSTSDYGISGAHMAERSALFIIIALGEGIVVTGATFTGLQPEPQTTLAFLIAFTGSVLMWWLYFDVGAKRGADHIEHHDDPGRVARNAYTYLHMPIVAGIVLSAVADEMLLAHPDRAADEALVVFLCGGIAIYLGAVGVFKRFSNPLGNFPLSHLIGLALLVVVGAWGWFANPSGLVFGAVVNLVLVVVAVWEWGSFHGGWRERLFPAKS